MNFCKGQNAFSDIPGFDASKGERIVKALQRLWEKIEYLEQMRISEKKSRLEKIHTNSKDEDLTITDIQYMLLVLQLKYARSILKKRPDNNYKVFHSEFKESDPNSGILDKHSIKNKNSRDFDDNSVTQMTEAGENKTQGICSKSSVSKNVARIDAEFYTDDELLKSEDQCDQAAASSYKIPSSKPHYHLKLDDVPFILGASSTASHSVVANVQNIIAMMKSHNKALCGAKQVSKSIVKAKPAEKDTQDATKMLNDLSRDLYELALKQQKLVKSIDDAQGKNQTSDASKNFQRNDKVIKKKHATDRCFRRLRSNSESEVKLQAEVKNFPKRKENDFTKCNVQQKQNLLNVRNQPSNLSIMDRRKLLRSLQNFKAHLSEEDISWD